MTKKTKQLANGKPRYSIVIPAYEEAILIGQSLETVHAYLKRSNLLNSTEVVVVAAQGKDDTASIAETKSNMFAFFQLVKPGPKVGKGRDVRLGMLAAKGEYLIFTDADLATPIEHCTEMFRQLESGEVEMSIGVRNLWKMHKKPTRKIMSVLSNWLVRLLLLPWVPDSQCGFKGFTRQTAHELFSKMTVQGWAFDMELLAIASQHKLSIGKIRIDDWTDPKLESGLVGESPLTASINTFKELLRIRKQRKKGQYT